VNQLPVNETNIHPGTTSTKNQSLFIIGGAGLFAALIALIVWYLYKRNYTRKIKFAPGPKLVPDTA
jgi:hypothetical protein